MSTLARLDFRHALIAIPFCLSITFLVPRTFADEPKTAVTPTSRESFCGLTRDPDNFKALAEQPENHLHFENRGGLFNGGVCWWHSRLQRSALYLSVFRPELPKPTHEQAEKIIHRLAANAGVVEIPGYSNLDSFSGEWWNVIQKKLDEWQMVDGFLKQSWIKGLSGSTHLKPAKLKLKMDALFNEVENDHRITWVMLQIPGIAAHAWNIVHIKEFDGGYELDVIDSNYPRTNSTFWYMNGADTLSTIYGATIPYVGRQKDFARFASAADRYCNSSAAEAFNLDEQTNQPLDNDFDSEDPPPNLSSLLTF
jgi:hypothetical protein